MYIYKFTHKDSGRSYIGQTIQKPNQRRLEHICDSKYTNRTYHFHNALRLYGIDAFTFEVLAEANSLEELNLLEEKYVAEFDSIKNGFNIRQPGSNKLHSEESKKRMSEAQKAAHARRRELNGGVEKHLLPRKHKGLTGLWKFPEDSKNKISKANKGRHKGMTWEEIYGTEVAQIRRQRRKELALRRKSGG